MESNSNRNGECNPKNLVIEVSNDNQNWEEIDRHQNDSALKGRYITATFKIKKRNNNFYLYVRLRQSLGKFK